MCVKKKKKALKAASAAKPRRSSKKKKERVVQCCEHGRRCPLAAEENAKTIDGRELGSRLAVVSGGRAAKEASPDRAPSTPPTRTAVALDEAGAKSLAAQLYLGAISKRNAEKEVVRRTSFKLYHQVSLKKKKRKRQVPRVNDFSDLTSELPLTIVYLASSGNYE